MKKACLANAYSFSYINLYFKILLILTFICSLFSIYSNRIDASQITNMENDDLLNQYTDIPLSDIFDVENQTVIQKLKQYIKDKSYSSVLETIAQLPDEDKNKAEIISLKAAALIGKGDYASALDEYNLLKIRNDTTSEPFTIIANMLLLKKRPFEAMMVCQSGLMRNIKSATLLYQMGHAYNLMGKTDTALAYYMGAKSANNELNGLKQQTELQKAIAVAYYKLNKYEEAKNTLSNIELINNDPGITLIINAIYQVSKGNFYEALSLLDKAQKSSRYLEAGLIKAQVFILNYRPKEAVDLINEMEVIHHHSGFSDMLKLTKALAFLTNDNADKSLELLKNLEFPEKIPNIHMLKAVTYFSMNNIKKSIEELKQTSLPYSELASLPDFERYLNQPSIGPDIGLAFFCLDQKFYDQAIIIAKKAAEKSKNNILLNFIIAECHLQNEDFSLAIKKLIELNDAFRGSYALQFYLSQAYAKADMIDEATETYKSLTEERPDFIMANLVYGKLLSDFSKWGEARKVYEHGLNFMPDSPQLQLSLGWVLVQLNDLDSLDSLLQIIEINEKITPASFLHLKGWSTFKNGDFSKAEYLLTKAIETAPGDPEICFHLGMTMMKSGKKVKAKNLLQQSLLFKIQRDRYENAINQALLENK